MGDSNDFVCRNATKALGKIGPAAVPALIKALRHSDDRWLRGGAAKSLGRIGTEEAMPELIEALGDPYDDVRLNAAEALGKIGPAAKQAVPALIETLGDPEHNVRVNAAEALGKIGRVTKSGVSDPASTVARTPTTEINPSSPCLA